MKKKIGLQNTKYLPYAFLAPAVILILAFLIYPVCNVFYYSLRNYNTNKPWTNGYIGLENFVRIFTEDKVFYSSLLVSIKWVIIEVALQFVLGLMLALVLNSKFKLRGAARASVFAPWAVSGVLTSMMWSLMYNQQMGVINDILMKLKIIKMPVAWLANGHTVLGSVILAELWRGIPFFAIMILAGLQGIPVEIYEACDVDGGNKLHKFRYVILPFLKDSIILSTLLRSVWEFNNVDLIYNLTGGGPAYATTTLVMYLANTATRDSDFGYGSALAVIAFFILLTFAIIYLKLSNFGKEDI